MKRTVTLTKNREFRRLYHKGRAVHGSLVITYAQRTKRPYNRYGITASTKIGNAVRRNRARRLIRESYRLLEGQLRTGFDFVFVARTKTTYSRLSFVMAELRKQLSETGALLCPTDKQPGNV